MSITYHAGKVAGLILIAIISPGIANVPAQHLPNTALQERDRGISLLEKGYLKEAIQALAESVQHDKNDPQAWRYFGLALLRNGDYEKARKALRVAVKLQDNDYDAHTALAYTLLQLNQLGDAKREALKALKPGGANAEGHYVLGAVLLREGDNDNASKEADAAIGIDPAYARAFLLKYQSLIDRYADFASRAHPKDETEASFSVLREASSNLRRYVDLSPNSNDGDKWRNELQALMVYASDPSTRVWALSKDVDTKARIVKKPEPAYTDSARLASINGIVTLLAIFTSDGAVRDVVVLRGLPNGLTEASINAARKINFVPAMKGGKPVSVPMVIQYSFSVF